jgi:hypothetical protein
MTGLAVGGVDWGIDHRSGGKARCIREKMR